MSNDQQLSNEKSLAIIHQMISQAKNNINENGYGLMLWGTLLFLTSLSTYFFINVGSDNIFMGWNVFGLITLILLVYDLTKPKKKIVSTYVDDLLRWVDIGFIVCLFTIIFAINVAVSANVGFGFFLMIFAAFMLIKAGAIKSSILKMGATINWVGSIAIFLNKDFKYDMLIMAVAVLLGYIIPGIILWVQYKKIKNNLYKNKGLSDGI